ncbi:hypothetical protein KTJ59_11620 [Acinetobacter baumannii]|nr:hypothetical protein [Acinetobacter baumannii]
MLFKFPDPPLGYSAVSFAGALLAGLGLLLVLFQIKRESSPAQTLQQCSD